MKAIEMTRTMPAATSASIDEFERRNGITLPSEFRTFLNLYNGGYPTEPFSYFKNVMDEDFQESCVGVRNFYSLETLSEEREEYAGRIPDDLLPVASDSFGNQICVGITGPRSNAVFFWDHEKEGADQYQSSIYRVIDSFENFIDGLTDY